jgi:hypothetical protein
MRIRLWQFIMASVIVGVVELGRRLCAAIVGARSIPLSPLTVGWYVGSEYLDRYDINTTGELVGEVDDFDVFARPDFDPDRVHPAVRRFYERTAEHRLAYEVTWHRGFRIGAALVSPFTGWIEQLNLPTGEMESRKLRSRITGITARADTRHGARAWIRDDPSTNEAVFVAIYARHQRDGITYTNIAVPLPGTNLSTVLHIDALETDGDGTGVTLTTDTGGDSGLYLVTPLCAITLPMEQRFRVWPADASVPDAPEVPDDPSTEQQASIVATHEMWLYDRKFLTIEYRGWLKGG